MTHTETAPGGATRNITVSFNQQAEEILDLIDDDDGRGLLEEMLATLYNPAYSDAQFREMMLDATEPFKEDYMEAFGA